LHRPRPDAGTAQRGAVLARPGDRVGAADRQQQLELLGEQLVVVVEVETEQRERLDERTTSGHDLGATAGQQVKLGELLEDPHRIIGAQHGHGTRQPDPLRPRRDRRERDGRRRDGEVGAMVLADGEHVEAELISELRLFQQVRHSLLRADPRAQVCEGR